jgi:hypothetical protein
MNKETAIVTKLHIERHKQVIFFEVKIPSEVSHIIGVEMGMRWISGTLPSPTMPVDWILPSEQQRNLLFGEISLQSYEKANLFFTGELVQNNNHAHWDFTSQFFTPKKYSHQSQMNEDIVKVNGKSSVIKGVYRDMLADTVETDYQYQVHLYLWTDLKEEPLKKLP